MKEKIEFKSEGYRLTGSLSVPRRNAPCILLCHGLASSKDSGKWPILAERLYAAGFTSLAFNFRGCGYGKDLSEGTPDDTTLSTRITDYRAALSFLENRDDVEAGRLGVVGSSLGSCVIIGAADSRPVAHAVLAAPVKFRASREMLDAFNNQGYFEYTDDGLETVRITKALYDDFNKYDFIKLAKRLKCTLFIHGSKDAIPVEDARLLYENAPEPKRLEIIEGGSHSFTDNPGHLDAVIDLVIQWFKRYL